MVDILLWLLSAKKEFYQIRKFSYIMHQIESSITKTFLKILQYNQYDLDSMIQSIQFNTIDQAINTGTDHGGERHNGYFP